MTIIPLSALNDNYIWCCIDPNTGYVAVIDPSDAEPVITYLTAHDLKLSAVLITHHHWDHTGGIAGLRAEYQAPVYGPETIPGITHPASPAHPLMLNNGAWHFAVQAVPGHTLDHIAYYHPGHLFCGDVLFSAGCGRVFEGTPEQMYASLQTLQALPAETKVYCAHEYTRANLAFAQRVEPGNTDISDYLTQLNTADTLLSLPSTLTLEKRINPFLRCEHPAVIASAESYANKRLTTPAAVFSALRTWKNNA